MARLMPCIAVLTSAGLVATAVFVEPSAPAPALAPAPAPGSVPAVPTGLAPAHTAPAAEEPGQAAAPPGLANSTVEDARRGGDAWNSAKVNRAAIPPMTTDTLSEAAIGAAEPGFEDLDCQAKDNVITLDEAATFGVKNGIPWSEMKVFFDAVDVNKDDNITLQEFNSALPVSKAIIEDLRPGFRDIDLDGNHLISKEEWMSYCAGWMDPKPEKAVCEKLFVIADTVEPKGNIDYTEFGSVGEKCKKSQGGNCLVLVSVRSSIGLNLLRTASSTVNMTGAQFFTTLVRRHRRAGGVAARVAARRRVK